MSDTIELRTDLPGSDEQQRMSDVRRYDILDTPPDGAFDRITRLAARICQVPISTITIVDEDRIWFKSTHGIEVDQIGRDPGLCASAVIQDDVYIVDNADVDPRTLNNPLVRGDLGLRFYVGVPLATSRGHNLGTLNVIDVEPRELSDDQIEDLRDLAAIVMDELELRLAAKATVAFAASREAARFRDAIIAGVSHEMRTPLAVLRSVSLLEEAEDGDPTGEVAELRSMRRRQLEHLDWLVRQFLDYTSLEDDRLPAISIEDVDLEPLVREAVDVFHGRGPTIDVQVAGRVVARADADRVRQIVIELLNNAVHFAASDDIAVKVDANADTVRIAVSDRGDGVAAGDRERIFGKAVRGETSTGTGLGLYLARIFAEAMGGRVDLDPRPGQGSTFTLVLPAASG